MKRDDGRQVSRAFSAIACWLPPNPGALPQAAGECCALGAEHTSGKMPAGLTAKMAVLHSTSS